MQGSTRSYEIARRLVSEGHDVHIITSMRERRNVSTDTVFESIDGISVHWIYVPYDNKMSYPSRILAFFKFAFYAWWSASSLNADIVIATSTPLTIAIPAVPIARRFGAPLIFEVRDLWPELPIAIGALRGRMAKFFARRLETWAYKNSAAVVALSPGMKQGVCRSDFPQKQVAVIPNFSDATFFARDQTAALKFRKQRYWLQDNPLIVYVGTIGKINGVDYLVELASHLLTLNSSVRLLIVGDGAEKGNVQQRALDAGVLGVNLFFENSMPKKDIPIVLSAADFSTCLFTDLDAMQSNSANKFFDTLASGTPIFINYGGWMHDIVNQFDCGVAAWRVPIRDAALQLNQILTNQVVLQQFGNSAKKLAKSNFDKDELTLQFSQVIELVSRGDLETVSSIAPGDYLRSQ